MMVARAWGPSAPVVPRLARSLRVLGREVDACWPGRDRASDGWIGDDRHQTLRSDHNPDALGIVHAIDLDVDGGRPWVVVVACVRDPRTEYVIYRGVIWSRSHKFHPRPYTGQDPHVSHLHVSIRYRRWCEISSRPWYVCPGQS